MRQHARRSAGGSGGRRPARSGAGHPLLDLQRQAGNQAVAALVVQRSAAGGTAVAPYDFGRFSAVYDDLGRNEFSKAYSSRRGERAVETMQWLLSPGMKAESRDAVRDTEQATSGLLDSIRGGRGDAQHAATEQVRRALGTVWINTFEASPHGSAELQIAQEAIDPTEGGERSTSFYAAAGTKVHHLLDLFVRDASRARAIVGARTGRATHTF
jgi:hypothetical protein